MFKELQDLSDKLREFMINNNNPVVMVGLFLGLLLVFMLAFNMLHKNGE